MRREEEHGGIRVEGVLGGIPVVVVPVDDDDPLVPVDFLRIPGRDRGVGVVAETLFGPGVVRVVPRRADGAERVPYRAFGHRVHGGEGSGYRELGHLGRDAQLADRVHVLAGVVRADAEERVDGG